MSMCENDREQNIYETGQTRPPKSHHSLTAVVLVAVIFFGGILRGSYLLNIPLIRLDLTAEQEDMPVHFARSPKLEAAQIPAPSAPVCADVAVELSVRSDPDVTNVQQTTVSVTCRTDTGITTADGIVLSENGYILVPCHILHRALSVSLQLPDGRNLSAAVVGMDRMSNLAVLYAPCSGLTPAEFGDSAQISVGDTVTVPGHGEGTVNALLPQFVTTATLPVPGAPLLNSCGQIIGIRTDPSDSHRALPSAIIKEIADQLAQKGFVSGRPDPGFTCIELTELDRKFYDLPEGIYIPSVYGDTDLLPGDILQSFDGVSVQDPDAFYQALYTHNVGDSVELSVIRDGKPHTLRLTLSEAK